MGLAALKPARKSLVQGMPGTDLPKMMEIYVEIADTGGRNSFGKDVGEKAGTVEAVNACSCKIALANCASGNYRDCIDGCRPASCPSGGNAADFRDTFGNFGQSPS